MDKVTRYAAWDAIWRLAVSSFMATVLFVIGNTTQYIIFKIMMNLVGSILTVLAVASFVDLITRRKCYFPWLFLRNKSTIPQAAERPPMIHKTSTANDSEGDGL
jgi:hypothetical protein